MNDIFGLWTLDQFYSIQTSRRLKWVAHGENELQLEASLWESNHMSIPHKIIVVTRSCCFIQQTGHCISRRFLHNKNTVHEKYTKLVEIEITQEMRFSHILYVRFYDFMLKLIHLCQNQHMNIQWIGFNIYFNLSSDTFLINIYQILCKFADELTDQEEHYNLMCLHNFDTFFNSLDVPEFSVGIILGKFDE